LNACAQKNSDALPRDGGLTLRINTNIPSLNAQRNLGSISRALSRSLERLSSGSRINSARDDASGLAVSLGLKAQAKGLTRTIQNMNEAFGYLNAADGALQTQMDLVQRMRELAIQAANGTLSNSDRSTIQVELDQLLAEFSRLSSDSSFNGVQLLDGSLENVKLQVGTQKGNTIDWGIESSTETDIFTEDVTTSTKQFASTSGSFGSGNDFSEVLDLNGDGADDLAVGDGAQIRLFLNDGEGNFSFTSSFSGAPSFFGLGEVGDFNNDGFEDLMSVNGNTRIVRLSDGRGGISSTVTTTLEGTQVNLYHLADFNNDGNLDMLSGGGGGTSAITLNLGTGTGSFSSAMTVNIGGASWTNILTTDLNQDDNLDLIITSGTNRLIQMGTNSGIFSAGTTIANVSSTLNANNIADMNGDGILDLVYLNAAGRATITLQTATGLSPTTSSNSGISLTGYTNVFTGDADGDGDLDAIFGSATANASLQLNNGSGVLSGLSTFSIGASNSIVGVADFNNDNIADMITKSTSQLFQLRNTGSGSFTTVATLSWTNSLGATIGDLNNDGYLDVWGVDANTGTFSQAFNSGGVIEGSGVGTAIGFESYNTTLADFNGDGFTDLFLNEILNSSGNFKVYLQNTVTNSVAATFDVQTQESASDALEILDNAINNISARRAEIGALQNRLASAINANSLTQENLMSAYSQIVDADIAQETAELTRSQIQQQAAASVLGQANVSLQMALQLLNA
jgi:flagellin